jgi:hypothetical protein
MPIRYETIFFAIGCFTWDDRKKRFSEIQVTIGATEQVMSNLSGASSVIAVNITDIVTRLRTKARAVGIDLSQPFFFPQAVLRPLGGVLDMFSSLEVKVLCPT